MIDELFAGGCTLIIKQNDEWRINKSLHYYSQVQGEMAIKNCLLCHFVVWTMLDIIIIPVYFDKVFWESVLFLKLVSYFKETVILKLIKVSQN